MILVDNTPATILFDSRGSQYFISIIFVFCNFVYFIILPMGCNVKIENDNIMTNKEYKLFTLVINGREFYDNFLVINGEGYDIILCMDWLSTFHEVIDCRRKILIF